MVRKLGALANDHGTRALFQAELDAERLRLRANLERLRDTLGEVATKTRSLGASIRRLGATGRDLVTKEQLHAPCDKEGEFFFCRDDGGSPMAEAGPGQRDRWCQRVHHEDRPAYERAEADRRKFGRPYTIEYRFSHPVGGELRWARETAWAIRDPASRHMLFGSYILDITEQKRAEEALRASEERYRAVVEDQSEYICRLDRDLT